MVMSVNTNTGAQIALQNLNATNASLAQVQNRINTGKSVSSAKDNGAIWAIAQGQRADIGALSAVKQSLDRGIAAVDVALAAGETVSDLLLQLKEKALAATDASLKTSARAALNEDFKALRDQIATVTANAEFNGVNLLKTGATGFQALANVTGTTSLTVGAEVLALGGANVTVATTQSIDTLTKAAASLTAVSTSIDRVSASLARLGTKSKALSTHLTFVGKLSDALEAGVGNLVDADLAKESAKLQALANAQGTASLTVNAEVMALGSTNVTVATTQSIDTLTKATASLTAVSTSIDRVSGALARLGTKSKAIATHITFVGKLTDALEAGVGNLVDADLAKESAKLQALQTKQQLGVQALGIANQTPQLVLSLFRG